ncbi:MAG: reverse transcriptase family protein [Colwellia sp.]|nr:reverse transcriptase family protein [Colwellia sp.]
MDAEDVETKWKNYATTTTEAFHHFFPVKNFTVDPSDAPWMTPRLKRLIKQRNRAYYTDRALFRSLRNKVIREIKAARKSFYPDRIHQFKQVDSSKWFGKIRALCGLQKQSSTLPCTSHLSPDLAAQEINSHFSSICQSLPPLNPSLLPAYLPSPSQPPSVQVADILTKLKKLRFNKSTTPYDLPIKLYKEFAPELALPLSSIINASLSQNSSPLDWKISYVTPIPKIHCPQSLSDLRPIAITPIPSLICEDFVFNWAFNQIKDSIDTQQFGNVKSSSTTHCLVNFLDFLHSHLDKRNTSLAVAFVDFRKAFDLVDHTVVLTKAVQLGLPSHLTAWLADFLTGRRQAVRYQGSVSPLLPLTCGVPQGTKMGPLCFLILINDALTDTPHRWKYVDDSTIGVPINTRQPDYSPLQATLDTLKRWTEKNEVAINHNKTVVMHFCTSPRAVTPPQLSVGVHPLQVVHSTKLLGVTLDDQLNWKQHVGNIVRTASYKLYMLRRLRSLGTPGRELCTVYTTFILPTLTYASPVWSSSLTGTQKQQLERVQKRACRIILGPAYEGYSQALSTLTLPLLSDRFDEALKRLGNNLLSHNRHRHFLPPNAPNPRQNTRHANKLVPIRAPRTDRYKNSAIPTIVHMINSG